MNPSRTLSLHNAAQSLVMDTRSSPLDPKEVMAVAAELYRVGPLNVELAAEVKRLQDIIDEVHSWAVCGCIATPEDMCQNLPHIVAITGPAGVPSVEAVPLAGNPTATVTVKVKSPTGYRSESVHHNITPAQWGDVVKALRSK